MYRKATELEIAVEVVSLAVFQIRFNKWDDELHQLMTSAEEKCRKFKSDDIAFSPQVTMWKKRKNLYVWIQGYKNGGKVNKCNLIRTCASLGASHPDEMTLEEAKDNDYACDSKLKDLERNSSLSAQSTPEGLPLEGETA